MTKVDTGGRIPMHTDEAVAAMHANMLVEQARDFIQIGMDHLVRRGADRGDTLLAFEAALSELKAE